MLARGYHVMHAGDADEAMALARDDHPDVIIINAPHNGDLDALNETIRIMKEIDEVIEEHGGWPDAFAAERLT